MSYNITPNATSSLEDSTSSGTSEGCLILPSPPPYRNSTESSPDISRDTLQLLSQSGAVLISLICIVGVPTNLLNLIVFYAQGLKSKVFVCMFAQSLDDILVLVTYFCWNFDTLFSLLSGTKATSLPWLKFVVNNYLSVAIGFMYVSGFLSTMISAERCWAVLRTFHSRIHGERVGMMVVMVVAAHVILLGSHVVVSAGIQVACVVDPGTNSSQDVLLDSSFKENHLKLFSLVHGLFFGLLLPGACLLSTTIVTVLTLIQLRKQSAWRAKVAASSSSSSSSSSRGARGLTSREVNLTRVLVAVSVVYIVCSVPRMAGRFSLLLDSRLAPRGDLANVFRLLILTQQQVFTCLNSSLNFFVYWTLGSKFRATLSSLLASCCGSRLSPDLDPVREERAQVSTVTTETALKVSACQKE